MLGETDASSLGISLAPFLKITRQELSAVRNISGAFATNGKI
jgi:hypothetical protein